MSSKKSSWKGWIVAAVLLGGVVYAVMSNPQWRDFDWAAFGDSFRRVHLGWLFAATACMLSTFAIRVARWKRLMRPISRDVRFKDLLTATVIGFGALALLGRAGEFVRPYLIARQAKVPVAGQISIWLIERFLDMLMILGLAGTAISYMDWGTDSELAEWARGAGYGIIGVAGLACVVLFVLPQFFDQFKALALKLAAPLPMRFQDKLADILTRLGEGFQGLCDFPSVAYAFGSSALMWFVLWLAFDFLLRACLPGQSFDPQQVLVFMGFLMVGSVLQVPGIGGGVQVATVATLTRVFGVDEEPASVAAIVIWLATFMVAVPPALFLLARQGLSLRSLGQLNSED